jgi:hypothetical protein
MFDWVGIMEIPGMPTLISIMLGFGLAALFRPLCKGPECLILRGPPVADIKGAAFQFGNKCVEFIPKPQKCPTGEQAKEIVQTLSFADLE